MEIAFAGNKLDLLERYPELQFLMHCADDSYTERDSEIGRCQGDALNLSQAGLKCSGCSTSAEPIFESRAVYVQAEPMRSKDVSRELAQLNLDEVAILYVYGARSGHYFAALEGWLKEKKDRRLIFLEDELSAIKELLHSEHAESLFSHPQVVIHFLSSAAKLEEIVETYPCDRIEVVASELYRKGKKRQFQKIRLKLLRQSTVAHAILTESLYAHKMIVNLLCNIKRWDGAFFAGGLKGKFKGIPAVICGAGPSLQADIPLLKTMEDRALIIAGGSTIAALSHQGIQPHLGIALDPNPEEFERLKIASAFEMPLLFATRVQPDIFNALNGERGYLITYTGGPCEYHFEQEVGIVGDPIGPELGPEALSVTTLSVALAVEMGCNPILLDGIDLAYTGMRRYAEGILPSSEMQASELRQQKKASERLLKRKDVHGHYVSTLVKWVMESECIAAYASAQEATRFINVTQGGIGFPGILHRSLSEVMQEELGPSLDLRALVHAETQRLKLPPLKEKIEQEMKSVGESLRRLYRIASDILSELQQDSLSTGKMALLEMDFQEEKAFGCLFPLLGQALDQLLFRAFPVSLHLSEEEKTRLLRESKIKKWTHWKEMIESEILVFQRHGNL
jgi:hypothetical protein